MPKKRPSRTALRRRARAERSDAPGNDYSREILRELERAGEPLPPKELAARLEIRGRERSAFSAGLAALERAGEVVQNRAGALLVAKRIAVLAGRVEGHPDGHGFLVPDEGGASVFLPPHEMRSLMHGDRAAVRVSGTDHRGRPLGALVEVLERAKRRIVGRLHDERGVLVLVPEDRRIAHDILVPPGEARKAKPGEIVTVDLVEQPARHAQPVGRIAEVLGHHADPGMEIEIALRKFDLPHRFSKQAMALARSIPDEVREQDIQARLTYTKVWADVAGGNPPEHLARLNELFQALYRSRSKRGAIDFETVETRMVFDPKGKIEKIVPETRNDAHRIIEECMLAANVCAGNFIAERGQRVLYRVHDVRAEEKVAALRAFLAELGLGLPGGDIPKPRDYAALLDKIRGRPDFQLLQTVLLRSLKQAMYTPENVGHFGLAFDAYVHFTSPIRRYPDLLVHRAIKALLSNKKYDGLDWEGLGRHCSETERRADDASRDVV